MTIIETVNKVDLSAIEKRIPGKPINSKKLFFEISVPIKTYFQSYQK